MKFLMCLPRHFRIDYEINVWMRKHRLIDHDLVLFQHEALREIYGNLGAEVLEIHQDEALPDMVYAANFGFVHGKKFVKSNFLHAQRKMEAEHAAEFFKERNYEVFSLPKEIVFEGQGDLFNCEGRFYCGHGFRTGRETIGELENIFEQKISALQLVDPRWYHLDTCFLPLKNNSVMIAPEAFDDEGIANIHEDFDKVIECKDEEDIENFACNSVLVGENLVTNKMSESLKAILTDEGYNVIETPMSEFLKGGGSVRCLTLNVC